MYITVAGWSSRSQQSRYFLGTKGLSLSSALLLLTRGNCIGTYHSQTKESLQAGKVNPSPDLTKHIPSHFEARQLITQDARSLDPTLCILNANSEAKEGG